MEQKSLEGVLGQLLELYQGLIDVAKRAPAEQLDKTILGRILDLEGKIDGLVKSYDIKPQYITEKDKDLIPNSAEKIGERVLRVDEEYQLVLLIAQLMGKDPGEGYIPSDEDDKEYRKINNWKGCIANITKEFIKRAVQEAKKFQADFVYNPSLAIEGSYSRTGDWIKDQGEEHFGVFTAEGRIVLYKAR